MTRLLTLVVATTVLLWLSIMVASLLRSRGWTAGGLMFSLSNRDHAPEPSALAGRADRASKNMAENFPLFIALALAAMIAAPDSPRALLGAQVFFWCRLVYLPIYYAGIPYLRTGVWAVSVVGLGMMVSALV